MANVAHFFTSQKCVHCKAARVWSYRSWDYRRRQFGHSQNSFDSDAFCFAESEGEGETKELYLHWVFERGEATDFKSRAGNNTQGEEFVSQFGAAR